MLPLAHALRQHGLSPLILEVPAHGTNAGSTTAMPQFARALEYTLARLSHEGREVRGLIGHSAGAAACAFAATRTQAHYRLVMIAPPESPQKYVSLFGRMFGLSQHTQRAVEDRIESDNGMLMAQFEAGVLGRAVRTPTLLVHDVADRAHSVAASERFAAHCPQALLIKTDGLGHLRILRNASTVETVAKFVAAH
jgi:pimeloyl-ACP methyl ester carboxylesterase